MLHVHFVPGFDVNWRTLSQGYTELNVVLYCVRDTDSCLGNWHVSAK